jgi:hypothetical protein
MVASQSSKKTTEQIFIALNGSSKGKNLPNDDSATLFKAQY